MKEIYVPYNAHGEPIKWYPETLRELGRRDFVAHADAVAVGARTGKLYKAYLKKGIYSKTYVLAYFLEASFHDFKEWQLEGIPLRYLPSFVPGAQDDAGVGAADSTGATPGGTQAPAAGTVPGGELDEG